MIRQFSCNFSREQSKGESCFCFRKENSSIKSDWITMNVEWWNKRTVRKLEKYLYTPLCCCYYYILDYHRLFFIIIINSSKILLIVIRFLEIKWRIMVEKWKMFWRWTISVGNLIKNIIIWKKSITSKRFSKLVIFPSGGKIFRSIIQIVGRWRDPFPRSSNDRANARHEIETRIIIPLATPLHPNPRKKR